MINEAENRTKETYEKSAEGLADYFKGIGSREEDIDRAFQLAYADKDSSVLELGCGDGRDAQSILGRSHNLTAMDYSEGLIKIAKKTNPDFADCFVVADVRTYDPPLNSYDIIFAFASLLHLNPDELKFVLEKYLALLSRNGIFYFSLKSSDEHAESIKDDRFGWRLFHLYNPDETLKMIPSEFKEIYRSEHEHGSTNWFTQAFQRTEA